jgi:hypothetical protein
VTCEAQDAAGNRVIGSFTVAVRDTTPPRIDSLAAHPAVLWPANHRLVPVTISVVATDLVDPTPACAIAAVSSNESPERGCHRRTPPDWIITGPLTLELRAEHSHSGAGRRYFITVICSDDAGNAASGVATVLVPRHQRR